MINFNIESSIYDFMLSLYKEIVIRDGKYLPSIHDIEVAQAASKQYNLPQNKIEGVFNKASKLYADKFSKTIAGESKEVLMKRMLGIVKENGEFPYKSNIEAIPPKEEVTIAKDIYTKGLSSLAEYYWCINSQLSSEDLDKLLNMIDNQLSVNDFFTNFLLGKNYKIVNIITKHFSLSNIGDRNKNLAIEAIDDMKKKKYNTATTSLCTLLEGLLCHFSDDPNSTKMMKVCNNQCEKAVNENKPMLYLKWYSICQFIKEFFKKSDFSGSEPDRNRHWFLHGRAERNSTMLDCCIILNACYAVLSIIKES